MNELGIVKKRKLVGLGDSLYLCVPKQFTRQHSLKKGDVMALVVGNEVLKVVSFKGDSDTEGGEYHG
jgi:hypothetical protein